MFRNILNTIGAFFSKKESYFALYRMLGFPPKNFSIYEKALLHKSSSKRDENGCYQNNERLEFLGDAIFNAIIAVILYKKFPTNDEGFLTNTRSKIVKRDTLDKIAYQLGINHLIMISAKVKNHKHIMGNTLEAFIGAIYLDKGYLKTKEFVEKRIINPYIDIDTLVREEVNFKSKLFEWCQKHKILLQFQTLENFTDNNRNVVFQIQALLNNHIAGIGIGYSKRESQQHASQMTWRKIRTDKIFLREVFAGVKKTNSEDK